MLEQTNAQPAALMPQMQLYQIAAMSQRLWNLSRAAATRI